ncbi:MAG: hypothetical protein NVSMB65_00890 [Chloroflexota bacterium]
MGTLNQAVLVLLLRIGLIVLLYLFLAVVVLAVRRDLARAATGAPGRTAALGSGVPGSRPLNVAALEVVNPGPTQLSPGHRFAVRNPTLIGRGTTNDINLDDEFVSNHHARLLLVDTTWHLEDLGSTNGTRLRGARVHGTVPLAPGDVVTVGRVELRLDVDATS